MATGRNYKRAKPSLEDRFEFVGDAVAPGDREALRSAMFDVEDRLSGVERCLKLWRKTGTAVDEDLRQLWLHEILRRTRKPPLHGKFAAWDNNDIVITSLNWASAATDPDFPWGDIGVHINAPGIANELVARLGAILPELRELESPENVA
jgi:hypothetical protein